MTGWRPPLREPTVTPELTAEMTNEDLRAELLQIQFTADEFKRVLLDREARDYIVASLSARARRA